MASTPLKYDVSNTVSPEGQKELAAFYGKNPALIKGDPPKTLEDFDKLAAKADDEKRPLSDEVAKKLGMSVSNEVIGGVNVLRLTPKSFDQKDGRILIYTHGGGFVVFSASVELVLPSLLGTDLGIQIVSIDYTLAPRGTYQFVTDQITAVYRGLLESGHNPRQIGMFGDSVGGNITAASVLKMRDLGLALPAALLLISPNTDLSMDGDTRMTLGACDGDPVLSTSTFGMMAKVWAPDGHLNNPYASPVHGDYSAPYPPTLIQGGTRELLLSDFVRLYRALIDGGKEAILDVYEGMPHVFQARFPEIPETRAAVNRASRFFNEKLLVDIPAAHGA